MTFKKILLIMYFCCYYQKVTRWRYTTWPLRSHHHHNNYLCISFTRVFVSNILGFILGYFKVAILIFFIVFFLTITFRNSFCCSSLLGVYYSLHWASSYLLGPARGRRGLRINITQLLTFSIHTHDGWWQENGFVFHHNQIMSPISRH